jgi:DNA-binding transcriptional LysR family regulator
MLRRNPVNIPSEILRSVVMIDALGGVAKAADQLGMTQSAISMQLKKLNGMVGGTVFDTSYGGAKTTPFGRLVLTQAKRFLRANDQILALGGATDKVLPLRLGLPSLYAKEFLEAWQRVGGGQEVSITAGYAPPIISSFTGGHLDVICVTGHTVGLGDPVAEWRENLAWVRARDFFLPVGQAIPVVAVPGSSSDNPMIAALEKASLSYRVTFSSSDKDARYAAVDAKYGITVLPARFVPSYLAVAAEDVLPELPSVPVAVFVSPDCDADRSAVLIETVRGLSPPAA